MNEQNSADNSNLNRNDESEFNLDMFIKALRKHPLIIILIFIATCALGLFIVSNMPKKYTSSGSVIVKREDKVSEKVSLQRSYTRVIDNWAENEVELFTNDEILGMVVDELKLVDYFKTTKTTSLKNNVLQKFGSSSAEFNEWIASFLPKQDEEEKVEVSEAHRQKMARTATIGRIKGMISIRLKTDTSLVNISVTCVEDGYLAGIVSKQIIKSYKDYKRKKMNEPYESALATLNKKLADQNTKYKKYEKLVRDIRKKYEITNSVEDKIVVSDETILELKSMLTTANVEFSKQNTLYQEIEKISLNDETGFKYDESLAVLLGDAGEFMALKNQYNEAELTFETVALECGEKHPDYIKAKKSLDVLKKQLSNRIDGVKKGFAIKVKSSKNEVDQLKKQIALLEKSISGERADHISEFNSAIEVRETCKEYISAIDKQIRNHELNREVTKTSLEIIQNPATPKGHSSPNYIIFSFAVFVFSTAFAIGIPIALEFLHTNVQSIDELESITGGQVLCSIPNGLTFIKDLNRSKQSLLLQLYKMFNANVAFNTGLQESGFVPVISITSALAAEGKTTVASNWGVILANAKRRVLLIDADPYKGSASDYFYSKSINEEKKERKGLLSYLSGEVKDVKDLIVKNIAGIDIIPACRTLSGKASSVHLNVSLLQGLVDELKKYYDVIIFDCPPLMCVDDALFISSVTDATVMVVRYDKTPKKVVDRCYKQLKGIVGDKLVGTVFNAVKSKGSNNYYYNQTGYGYAGSIDEEDVI